SFTYSALHRSFIHRIISFFSFMISSFFVGLSVKNVDLVWGTTPPIFQSFTAWLLSSLKRIPFLLEVRDLWPAFAIAVGVLRNPVLIKLSLWLESFLYSHANLVMVNSPGYIQHVTSRGAKHVELVPNGVDVSMFSPDKNGTEIREKYHLEKKFVTLYAGAFGLSNDLGIVLNSANLLKDHPEIVFLMVGDGKEKNNLQQQALDYGLNNILFIPPVAKSEMDAILAAANLCIAILKPIELYKTTYPNKVFDYMAAGRPVLLAIDGVIRDVVEKAQAGVMVPPGDAESMAKTILNLSLSPDTCLLMGKNGRAYVEKYYDRKQTALLLESLLLKLRRSNA
ncbi:MAG: glycosyltransferase family 4 protein, partial [Anaerolineae bacterium]|nr:glycosyltransferase family 4 protein [Anaerolineae bacterium]